eukprot:15465510-Alexandrium_andersonii.AAC.1
MGPSRGQPAPAARQRRNSEANLRAGAITAKELDQAGPRERRSSARPGRARPAAGSSASGFVPPLRKATIGTNPCLLGQSARGPCVPPEEFVPFVRK